MPLNDDNGLLTHVGGPVQHQGFHTITVTGKEGADHLFAGRLPAMACRNRYTASLRSRWSVAVALSARLIDELAEGH